MMPVENARSTAGTTSAVLWLMILIVFLPIALFHAFAVRGRDAPAAAHAAAPVSDSRPGS